MLNHHSILFSIFVVLFISACVDGNGVDELPPEANDNSVNKIEISTLSTSTSMLVGDTQDFDLVAVYADQSRKSVNDDAEISIDDESIVSISNGILKALKEGSTKINISYEDTPLTIDVQVIDIIPTSIQSLKIEPVNSTEIVEDYRLQLTLSALLTDATTKNVTKFATWESNLPNVISVNDRGLLTTHSPSLETVTIKASVGEISITQEFLVVSKTVRAITLSPNKAVLLVDQKSSFSLFISYNNNSSVNISDLATWSVGDDSILDMESSSSVTALSKGVTQINAVYEDVKYSANVHVLGDMYSRKVDKNKVEIFYEKASIDSDLVNSPSIKAFMDSTTYGARDNGEAELIVDIKNGYNFYSESYNEALKLTLFNVALGTHYTADGISITHLLPGYSGTIYEDFIAISRIDDVGGFVVGSYAYWLCSNNENCRYITGEFVANKEEERVLATQGSIDNPFDLGDLPLRKEDSYTVLDKAYSYYALNVDADTDYRVRLITDRQVELAIYNNADFTTDELCLSLRSSPYCDITPPSDKLYLRIKNGNSFTSAFKIQVLGASSVGSIEAPVDFTHNNIKYIGQSNNGEDSYYRMAVDESSLYSLRVYNRDFVTGSGGVYVYSTPDFSSSITSFSINTKSADIATQAEQSHLYIKIRGYNDGSYYFLSLFKREFSPIGSIADPTLHELAPNSLDIVSEVDTTASYFEIDVDSSRYYSVILDDLLDNADLFVYSNANFSNEICRSDNIDTSFEQCFLDSGLQKLYVMISGNNAALYGGTDFQLQIGEYFKSQGTVTEPTSLNSAPFTRVDATVGSIDGSYYTVSIMPNSAYQIELSSSVRLRFSATFNENFSSSTCSGRGGSSPSICKFESGDADFIYIFVAKDSYTPYGQTFSLSLNTRIFTSDGLPSTPVDKEGIPISFYSEVNTTAGYYVMRAEAGKTYRFQLNSLFDNLDLYVYSDLFANELCRSVELTNIDESCIAEAPASGKLHIKVDGSNANQYGGSEYRVIINREFPSEGGVGLGNPVALPAVPFSNYQGSTNGTELSYYEADVITGNQYLILLEHGLGQSMSIAAYEDADFTTPITCSSKNQYGNSSCVTAELNTDKLYFSVNGNGTNSYKMRVSEQALTQGDITTPVDLGTAPITMFESETSSPELSYYQVAVEEDTTYYISLNGSSSILSLTVYADSTFSTAVTCTDSGNRYCTYTTLSGETMLYLTANLTSTNTPERGAYYHINVMPPPVSQGTSSAPHELTSMPTSKILSIGDTPSSSYYTVPVTSNTEYSIVLHDAPSNAYLFTYEGESFSKSHCSRYYYTSLTYVRCDYITQEEQTELYFAVRDYSSSGQYLNVSIEETP